jgi:integrase
LPLGVGRVHLLAGTLDVAVSASDAGGWHVGPTKTAKRRTLIIPRFLADEPGEHLGRYPSTETVFTTAEGCPVSHATSGPECSRRRAQTLPAGLRWHDLRHTCAALLIASGRHLEEVKTYLGHSSIRATPQPGTHAHLFPQARAAMAEALDATYRGSVAKRTAPIGNDFAARRKRNSRRIW